MKTKAFFGILVFLSLSTAHAGDRLRRDPRVNVDQLTASGQIAMNSSAQGTKVSSDASAVLKNIDFSRLTAAAADYDHYKQMGMPYVLDSRIVSRAPGADVLTTWTWMRTWVAGIFAQDSKHYLEVRLSNALPSGASGAEWQLVHPSTRPFADESAFTRLDGSWYAEPLPDGQSAYVRYTLEGVVSNGLAGAFQGIVKAQFTDGVRLVIQTLARQAALHR